MAAKGTAVLIAVAIGVSLGLLDQSRTSGTPAAPAPAAPAPTSAPSPAATTTAVANSTVVVTSDSSRAPAPLSECPGRVVGQLTEHDVTLRVFYDSQARGTNCVAAIHQGPVTAPGFLRIEIRVDGSTGTDWPRYMARDGSPGAAEVAGAYLIGTDGHCVSATATYLPNGTDTSRTSLSLAGVGCG
jgi:hypothetical protein